MEFLTPDWPVPAHVKAFCTTRKGGVSQKTYDSFNLATHTGDERSHVLHNRRILKESLHLKNEPLWLTQVHGIVAVEASTAAQNVEADASFTTARDTVCAVLTADCLPVLLCDQKGTCVAAVHAGWRGLLAGVLEATIQKMPVLPRDLLAWYGPALGPTAFEVGADVRDSFIAKDQAAAAAFRPIQPQKWLGDIYQLADLRLHQMGVTRIFGERLCTASDPTRFYSYRKEGTTGRMASMIWLAAT